MPYRLLFPSIIVFCCIGIYSINNSPTDVLIVAAFGVFGFWLVKHDFEPAPLLLGFVLGPLMEENLRRAMLIARGDATVFFTRPISGGSAVGRRSFCSSSRRCRRSAAAATRSSSNSRRHPPIGRGQQALAALVKSEIARWTPRPPAR